MVLICRKFIEYLPSINRLRQTWRMVHRAAKKLGALIRCVPLRLDGYFVPAEISASGKPEIYVDSKLSEDLQIATAIHELKHAIFDYPIGEILFSYRSEWTEAAQREQSQLQKFENEACAMGAIALLPIGKLKHASLGLFDVDDEFLTAVWAIRLYIYETYGI